MVKSGNCSLGKKIVKIPKNLSEEETLEKIKLVVDRIAPKYSFSGYDINDIKQEAYIICFDALNRYDECRPLENFLSVNLSNRLKNFIRDNYCKSSNEDKRKIVCPLPLPSNDISSDDSMPVEDKIFISEIKEKIEQHLPAHLRMTYLKYMSNVSVAKHKKEELLNFIKSVVLKENINNEEG